MIPRRFLVKAILLGIQKNQGIPPEILASRIADKIAEAAEIFEADDDPMPTEARDRFVDGAVRQAPHSPEDFGEDNGVKNELSTRLPQPPPGQALIIAADSEDGRRIMAGPKTIVPIRPVRAVEDGGSGDEDFERPKWDFNTLYATVMGVIPETIKVVPNGQTGEIELSRSFQANKATGTIKVVFISAAAQRESTPSMAPPVKGMEIELQPMAISVDVSRSFSIFDGRDLDFDRAVFEIKEQARKSFAPRSTTLQSRTPVIMGRTIEGMVSEGLRSGSAPTSPYSGNSDNVYPEEGVDPQYLK